MKIKAIIFFFFILIQQAFPTQPEILKTTAEADSVSIEWEISNRKPVLQSIFIDTVAIVDTTVAQSALLPTQVLLMVDTSIPMRPAIKPIREYLQNILSPKPTDYKFAFVTFDDGMQVQTNFAAETSTLFQKIGEIRATGKRTELYRSIIEGIELFSTTTPVHKIIVIFSDGKAEDTPAYPISLVLEKAREKDILIFSAAYRSHVEDPYDQNLRRLSEETGGYFERADARNHLSNSFQKKLFEPKKYRGNLYFKNSDLPFWQRFRKDLSVNLLLKFDDGTTVETPLDIAQNPLIPCWVYYLAGGVILLLVLALIILWILKRRKPRPLPIPGDSTSGAPVQPTCPACGAILDEAAGKCQACGTPRLEDTSALAWFESPKGEAWAVKVASCKIGALDSNHIVLNHQTISRHHAILDWKDGKFILTDRNSTNHTLVNDQKISSIELKNGDIVQFGSLQFRFLVNPRY